MRNPVPASVAPMIRIRCWPLAIYNFHLASSANPVISKSSPANSGRDARLVEDWIQAVVARKHKDMRIFVGLLGKQ